jgi:hypothetical protein
MFYVSTRLFQQKPTFCTIYIKMTKFDIKIGLFMRHVFVFFAYGIKNLPFLRNFAWPCRIWRYICAYFFSIFSILKFIFQIKGAYAHEIRIEFHQTLYKVRSSTNSSILISDRIHEIENLGRRNFRLQAWPRKEGTSLDSVLCPPAACGYGLQPGTELSHVHWGQLTPMKSGKSFTNCC